MADDVGTERASGAPDGFREALPHRVERWVDASLITRDQAEAILALETGGAASSRPIPLVTEALGYLGIVLIGGAFVALLVKLELGHRGWEMLLAILAIALFGGGWTLRDATEPALVRLAGVQWLLSVAAFVAFVGVIASAVVFPAAAPRRDHAEAIWTTIGLAGVVSALPLYVVRRRAAQILALFVTTLIAVPALIAMALGPGDLTAVWVATGAWALGIGWLVLARRGRAIPMPLALTLAAITIAFAPVYVSVGGAHVPVALALGIASTAGMMALSVLWRRTALLWVGAAGLFVYVAWFIGRYLSDALGLPLALLLGGIVLLALAVVTARLRESAV